MSFPSFEALVLWKACKPSLYERNAWRALAPDEIQEAELPEIRRSQGRWILDEKTQTIGLAKMAEPHEAGCELLASEIAKHANFPLPHIYCEPIDPALHDGATVCFSPLLGQAPRTLDCFEPKIISKEERVVLQIGLSFFSDFHFLMGDQDQNAGNFVILKSSVLPFHAHYAHPIDFADLALLPQNRSLYREELGAYREIARRTMHKFGVQPDPIWQERGQRFIAALTDEDLRESLDCVEATIPSLARGNYYYPKRRLLFDGLRIRRDVVAAHAPN